MKWSPEWIEAIGTWVGGLGTIGTLVYALVALRREAERRRTDVRALRDADRDSQDALARTVVMGIPQCGSRGGPVLLSYYVKIGNYGVHPITNFTAQLLITKDAKSWAPSAEIPEDRKVPSSNGGPIRYPVFKPDDEKELVWDVRANKIGLIKGLHDDQAAAMFFELEVGFTDVHGIRWSLRPGVGQQPSRLYDAD